TDRRRRIMPLQLHALGGEPVQRRRRKERLRSRAARRAFVLKRRPRRAEPEVIAKDENDVRARRRRKRRSDERQQKKRGESRRSQGHWEAFPLERAFSTSTSSSSTRLPDDATTLMRFAPPSRT